MLNMMEVMQLLADGKPLPQQQHGDIPAQVIDEISDWSLKALNGLLLSLPTDMVEEEQSAIAARQQEYSERYGWYQVSAILAMQWAYQTEEFDLDQLPVPSGENSKDIGVLTRFFQIAAQQTGDDADGAWTIPLAMMGSSTPDVAFHVAGRLLFAAAMNTVKNPPQN